MRKAEGEVLQRRIAELERKVWSLECSLAWSKQHNDRLREWNRKARALLGYWLRWYFAGHPYRQPVGSTRSHLKEW